MELVEQKVSPKELYRVIRYKFEKIEEGIQGNVRVSEVKNNLIMDKDVKVTNNEDNDFVSIGYRFLAKHIKRKIPRASLREMYIAKYLNNFKNSNKNTQINCLKRAQQSFDSFLEKIKTTIFVVKLQNEDIDFNNKDYNEYFVNLKKLYEQRQLRLFEDLGSMSTAKKTTLVDQSLELRTTDSEKKLMAEGIMEDMLVDVLQQAVDDKKESKSSSSESPVEKKNKFKPTRA